MSAVAVAFAVTGPLRDVVSGVQAFKARFSGTRVEGLPAAEGSSISERLAEVDQLLADRVISSSEHSEQRARILDEL